MTLDVSFGSTVLATLVLSPQSILAIFIGISFLKSKVEQQGIKKLTKKAAPSKDNG